MLEAIPGVYEKTDRQALEVGSAVLRFIFSGNIEGLPLGFRGLDVFGAVAVLRENDEIFYGETSPLTDEERQRLNEIELDIEDAIAHKMHYHPFGHDRHAYSGSNKKFGYKSSWGNDINRRGRAYLLHEKQRELDPLDETFIVGTPFPQ